MRAVVILCRVVFGAIFLIAGLNGLFQFFPMPAPPEGPAIEFMSGLIGSSYFFPFLALIQACCGFLLLIDRFVPLALTIIAPVTVNILAYHLFLAPSGIVLGLVVVGLNVFLAFAYRNSFTGVLASRAEIAFRRQGADVRRGRRGPGLREPAEA